VSSGFKTALAYLAAFGLLEALAIYVMDNYERVRLPEWVGYSGEASRNSYLAAQRFVVAMGRDSRGVDTLYDEATLPPASATIVVSGDRRLMTPPQSRRLLAWVKSGGDLVVTVGDDVSKDPLLEAVGVRLFAEVEDFGSQFLPGDYIQEPENWVQFDAALDGPEQPVVADDDALIPDPEGAAHDQVADGEDGADDEDEEGDDEDDEATALVKNTPDLAEEPRILVHIPGSAEVLKVSPFAHELVSNEPGGWQVSGNSGALALREPYGEGTITVLGSLWFIENQIIGDADHAAFFWGVLSSAGHSGPVWFVFGDDVPSIWATIAQYGWPALAALGLLVGLLLWRYMPRVGAPIAPLAPVRRELIEHVDATGRFLVDHAGGHVLVASVQKHVKRRLLMKYPQVAALPERERRGRLAQLAKLSSVEVDAIYRPQVGLSRTDFVAVQRVLERLSQ
jgi:hypothetical protein